MSRRNRPSAYEVSFPDEVSTPPNIPSSSTTRSSASVSTAGSRHSQPSATADSAVGPSKRRSSNELRNVSLGQKDKRPRTGDERRPTATEAARPKLRYSPQHGDIKEKASTVIAGEDQDDYDNDSTDNKPVRILSEFCVFDPIHDMEVISLSLLDDSDGVEDRHFQAAGYVSPLFLNEEDAGQEDELDENLQHLQTTAIFRWSLDYTRPNEPIYIETSFAWYILNEPSRTYQQLFYDFYRPHRIAQMVISTVAEHPTWSFTEFTEFLVGLPLGIRSESLRTGDIPQAVPAILSALEDMEDGETLASSPILRRVLQGHPFSPTVKPGWHRAARRPPPHRRPVIPRISGGNIDTAVLRQENQNPTTVTPLIDELSLGLFNEHLQVVGPPPKAQDKTVLRQRERRARLFLFELFEKTTEGGKRILSFPSASRIQYEFWEKVVVDGEEYSVGDVVLLPAGKYENREEPEIPEDLESLPESAMVADFFWFAKIIYINQRQKRFHVQWFEHSSRTILEEISNPRELFLCPTCDDIDIQLVVAKVTVHQGILGLDSLGPGEYFYNFMYNEAEMSFSDLNDTGSAFTAMSPPDNCLPCLLIEQRELERHAQQVHAGFAYQGNTYHQDDYVLIKRSSLVTDEEEQNTLGPALVGHVLDFHFKSRSRGQDMVTVQLLERISTIANQCPAEIVKNEHHLFMTDTKQNFALEDILQPCIVLHPHSVPDLDTWLSHSPFHFFMQYRLQTPPKWSERQVLETDDILVCESCIKEEQKKLSGMKEFLAAFRHQPLRAFDPFGGASKCMRLTHAVEISPSAAKTLQANSPNTITFNQCSNVVLRYAVKMHQGLGVEVPKSLGDLRPLSKPPQPGDVDVIIGGFPCQPHSRLNMFQRANDRKSHLILNLLAWVDFLKPKFCFFENVRGFLSYNLNATQAGRYQTKGGIKMGGLKFLIRALLAMNYQVRFGLLQAAHYGTPQARVRFFLVAARSSYILPHLPQPTHDFPLVDSLEIKFPNGQPKRPIRTARGVAPFPFVTIEDAIADLPRFDWENPHKLEPRSRKAGSERSRRTADNQAVPVLPCDRRKAHCGLSGAAVEYHYNKPRTSFQARCRARPTEDLQHFTRVLKDETVERYVLLAPCAGLHAHLWDWQIANPSSANARDGYRPGLYGRLDSQAWFHTTVTNVEPTAKQSWVLNPFRARAGTLAGLPGRLVFHSVHGDVKTMQRQIGNAVPWPVAVALGRELQYALFTKWQKDQEEAIVIE
ncbi:S-adenosyl-L-methionine-dependent methyltransferase [Amylocystis lapponica]|nr:S-adenosyl-L-methionine-dependent methyltransferase [Amylocystis lapponica]